jgi:hypothetical protein
MRREFARVADQAIGHRELLEALSGRPLGQ